MQRNYYVFVDMACETQVICANGLACKDGILYDGEKSSNDIVFDIRVVSATLYPYRVRGCFMLYVKRVIPWTGGTFGTGRRIRGTYSMDRRRIWDRAAD